MSLDSLVETTKDKIGAIIQKPKMTDKLLQKPPFRFLHDTITAIIQATGFGNDLYTPDESDSSKVNEKQQKIPYLEKMINLVGICKGTIIDVRAAKIVAGLEPENTNIFLIALAECCTDSDIDGPEGVRRVLAGEVAGSQPAPAKSSVLTLSPRGEESDAKSETRDEAMSSSSKSKSDLKADDIDDVKRSENDPVLAERGKSRGENRGNVGKEASSEDLSGIASRPPELDAEIEKCDGNWEFTRDSLGSVIKKPKLTKKLLGKPRFRFLHGIFMEVVRETGFATGLYTPEEMDSANDYEKSQKIIFLEKMVKLVGIQLNIVIEAKAAKIVARLEPEKTNILLQLLAVAIKFMPDSTAAVQAVLSGEGSIPIAVAAPAPAPVEDKPSAKSNAKVEESVPPQCVEEKMSAPSTLTSFCEQRDEDLMAVPKGEAESKQDGDKGYGEGHGDAKRSLRPTSARRLPPIRKEAAKEAKEATAVAKKAEGIIVDRQNDDGYGEGHGDAKRSLRPTSARRLVPIRKETVKEAKEATAVAKKAEGIIADRQNNDDELEGVPEDKRLTDMAAASKSEMDTGSSANQPQSKLVKDIMGRQAEQGTARAVPRAVEEKPEKSAGIRLGKLPESVENTNDCISSMGKGRDIYYPQTTASIRQTTGVPRDGVRIHVQNPNGNVVRPNMDRFEVFKRVRVIAENLRTRQRIVLDIPHSDYDGICKRLRNWLEIVNDYVSLYVMRRGYEHGVGGGFGEVMWMTEVVGTDAATSSTDAAVNVADLRDNDCICVRSSLENVGPLRQLSSLSTDFKFNLSMVGKVEMLNLGYCGWRPVRGDGNCYYRAVIFSVFEQIIVKKELWKFRIVRDKFTEISEDVYGDIAKCDHDRLLRTLEGASEARCWTDSLDLETSMIRDSALDLAAVRGCRRLVARYLLDNQQLELNGISVRDAILPSYPDVKGMPQYCHKYVTAMGVDAEGPLVDAGILILALSCSGCNVLFDRRSDVPLMTVMTEHVQFSLSEPYDNVTPENEDNLVRISKVPSCLKRCTTIANVHLLLRPGHYDLLYPHPEIPFSTFGNIFNMEESQTQTSKLSSVDKSDPPSFQEQQQQQPQVVTREAVSRVTVKCQYPLLVRGRGVFRLEDGASRLRRSSVVPMRPSCFVTDEPVTTAYLRFRGEKQLLQEAREVFAIPAHCGASLAFDRGDAMYRGGDESVATLTVRGQRQVHLTVMYADRESVDSKLLLDLNIITGNAATVSPSIALTAALTSVLGLSGYVELRTEPGVAIVDLPDDALLYLITYMEVTMIYGSRRSKSVTVRFDPRIGLNGLESLARDAFKISARIKCVQIYRIVDSGNSMSLVTNENIGYTIKNNANLSVQFCESVNCAHFEACDFQNISQCQHLICHNCIYEVVTQLGDGDSTPFTTPKYSQNVPELKEFKCPALGCECLLSHDDIVPLRQYLSWYVEFERKVEEISSYQICALAELICGGEREPIANLIQFNCGHFFHKDCVATYINNEISKCKASKTPLICVCCTEDEIICECPYCILYDSCHGHMLWTEELRATVGNLISDTDYDFVEKLSVYFSTKATGSKLFQCTCGVFYIFEQDVKESQCPCGYRACLKCEREVHDSMSCKDAHNLRHLRKMIDDFTENGVVFQCCPSCRLPWLVPLECQHVTCDKNNGGCGTEFCYLCAALRAPIVAHSNAYHRPECEFYTTCCDSRCMEGGGELCKLVSYKPDECSECAAAGNPCLPPKNFTEDELRQGYKILTKRLVEDEAKNLSHK